MVGSLVGKAVAHIGSGTNEQIARTIESTEEEVSQMSEEEKTSKITAHIASAYSLSDVLEGYRKEGFARLNPDAYKLVAAGTFSGIDALLESYAPQVQEYRIVQEGGERRVVDGAGRRVECGITENTDGTVRISGIALPRKFGGADAGFIEGMVINGGIIQRGAYDANGTFVPGMEKWDALASRRGEIRELVRANLANYGVQVYEAGSSFNTAGGFREFAGEVSSGTSELNALVEFTRL